MWQTDPYAELVAALSIASAHGSQLAQDLEILASREFAAVSLADRHSRASALMPQKRNPYALAVIRTQAGIAAGELAGLLVTLHSGSARTDHFHLLNGSVPRLLEQSAAVSRLEAEVVAGLELYPERFARAAREGFTAAADVADALAQEGGLDYRTAHRVVGRAVRDLVDEGLPPDALTPERVVRAGEEAVGRRVAISAEQLAAALDPEAAARSRRQTGSSAPEEVASLSVSGRRAVAAGRRVSEEARAVAEAARTALLEQARALSGRG
jgi:argininosuccinate lyase